jgi:hypothetical protein
VHSVLPAEPLIIEHLISMITISKTSLTYKPLYIQEKPDILIEMDTALNFPCKRLLKNLAFLCQIGLWLVKSRYSTWTQCAKEQLIWQKMKTVKYGTVGHYLRDVGLCSRMSKKTEDGKT